MARLILPEILASHFFSQKIVLSSGFTSNPRISPAQAQISANNCYKIVFIYPLISYYSSVRPYWLELVLTKLKKSWNFVKKFRPTTLAISVGKVCSLRIFSLPTPVQCSLNTFHVTEVCILLFSNIERGNRSTGTCSCRFLVKLSKVVVLRQFLEPKNSKLQDF